MTYSPVTRLTCSAHRADLGKLPGSPVLPSSSLGNGAAGTFENDATSHLGNIQSHGTDNGMSLNEARAVMALVSHFRDDIIARACSVIILSSREDQEREDATEMLARLPALVSAIEAMLETTSEPEFSPVTDINLGELIHG